MIAGSVENRAVPADPPARQVARARRALLAAARSVFEDQGYENTRVDDIAAAALYSTGTFYTHFASKEQVFGEVLQLLDAEPPPRGPAPAQPHASRALDLGDEINKAVARAFHAYARDERRWAVLEEGRIRAPRGHALTVRATRRREAWLQPLAGWQQHGLLAAEVPLAITVDALLAMTDWLIALDRVYRYTFPQRVGSAEVTRVWCIALGLRRATSPNRRRSDLGGHGAAAGAPTSEDGRLAAEPTDGLGPRGLRTRSELVTAGRRLFARARLADVGIRDIAGEAGVSVGTFYKYFRSKDDVLEEILIGVQRELLAPTADHSDGPVGSVRAANHAWFRQVHRHAGLWQTLSEAAITTPAITTIWARRRRAYTLRLEAAFGRWAATGLISCPLGPRLSAIALGAMTERLAHVWFVLGEREPPVSAAVAGVTDIWLDVLGGHGRT